MSLYAQPDVPAIIEEFGVPEFFANGVTVRKEEETVSLLFYVTRGDGAHEIVRIHMPRGGYCKSSILRKHH